MPQDQPCFLGLVLCLSLALLFYSFFFGIHIFVLADNYGTARASALEQLRTESPRVIAPAHASFQSTISGVLCRRVFNYLWKSRKSSPQLKNGTNSPAIRPLAVPIGLYSADSRKSPASQCCPCRLLLHRFSTVGIQLRSGDVVAFSYQTTARAHLVHCVYCGAHRPDCALANYRRVDAS